MPYELSLRWVLPEGTTTVQPKLQMRHQFVSASIGGPPVKAAPWVDVPTVVDPVAYGAKLPSEMPSLERAYPVDTSLDKALADAFKNLGASQKTIQESLAGTRVAINPGALQLEERPPLPFSTWYVRSLPERKVRVRGVTKDSRLVLYSESGNSIETESMETWTSVMAEVWPSVDDVIVGTEWVHIKGLSQGTIDSDVPDHLRVTVMSSVASGCVALRFQGGGHDLAVNYELAAFLKDYLPVSL